MLLKGQLYIVLEPIWVQLVNILKYYWFAFFVFPDGNETFFHVYCQLFTKILNEIRNKMRNSRWNQKFPFSERWYFRLIKSIANIMVGKEYHAWKVYAFNNQCLLNVSFKLILSRICFWLEEPTLSTAFQIRGLFLVPINLFFLQKLFYVGKNSLTNLEKKIHTLKRKKQDFKRRHSTKICLNIKYRNVC